MFCNRCGHSNLPDVTFCAVCAAVIQRDDTFGRRPALSSTVVVGDVDPTAALPVPHHEGALPGTGSESPDERDPARPLSAALVVRGGDQAGETFPLSGPVTRIGRGDDCNIRLDDITVSRCHVEIQRWSTRYVVRDAGSLNGTYVNSQRVVEAVLRHDDELRVGKFRFVFVDPT